ncbi:hypothetical protein RDI58_016802 [Solanum bulbocastanum]|uniref:Reticulon-like protein n=1 Tax=Solanum bulbocastanum TaxID=147425 RepID=A0AAN8YDA9_SOLBU
MLLAITLVCVFGLLFHLYNSLITKPRKLQLALKKQGIIGPQPKFLLGNILEMKKSCEAAKKFVSNGDVVDSHNCGATILPFFAQWQRQYGEVFMFSLGNTQIVHVTQPEMVREITTCTSLDLGKPAYQAKERGSLLGNGILTSNGPFWAHQRKILAPELYMEKVKGMINLVQDSASTLLSSWNNEIEAQGGIADIKIDPDLRRFSGDVISKACFGSNFSKGEEIFYKLRALQEASSKRVLSTGIPGIRYIPSKNNRETWALEKEIKALILKIVKEKQISEAAPSDQKDLLQMVLEGATINMNTQNAIDNFIVDNCKNIYLAGYETTAVAATWCLMLLAANPIWQQRVRDEVVQICKGKIPDADMIRQMKQLTMVINESLRLYPPVAVISREALKEMKFGEINVPKGVNLWTIVTTLHTDPKIWGNDSYKFNPQRFANGIRDLVHFYLLGELIKMSNPVEEIVGESTLENKQKALNHNDSSSSSSTTDDDFRRPIDKKKCHLFDRHKPIHSTLGGGKLADILLWRKKKISGGLLAGATVIWFLFECSGYHLLTLICHSLIVSLAILFFWSNLSLFVNKSFVELPKIELPEELWMRLVLLLRDQCTCASGIFREVASGNDLKKFLYAIFSLWIVSIVGRWFSFLTLVYLITVMLLTVSFFYEKYGDQVDTYGEMAIKELRKQYSQVDEKVLQKLPIPFIKDSKQE